MAMWLNIIFYFKTVEIVMNEAGEQHQVLLASCNGEEFCPEDDDI